MFELSRLFKFQHSHLAQQENTSTQSILGQGGEFSQCSLITSVEQDAVGMTSLEERKALVGVVALGCL